MASKWTVSKGNNCSFRHDENKRLKSTSKSTQSSEPLNERDERKSSRRMSSRYCSPSGKPSRPPCRKYLRGNCTNPSCSYWHPPECLHWRAEEQPSKQPKVNGDETAVAMLKDTRQLGCVFQDAEPPKSSSVLRTSGENLSCRSV